MGCCAGDMCLAAIRPDPPLPAVSWQTSGTLSGTHHHQSTSTTSGAHHLLRQPSQPLKGATVPQKLVPAPDLAAGGRCMSRLFSARICCRCMLLPYTSDIWHDSMVSPFFHSYCLQLYILEPPIACCTSRAVLAHNHEEPQPLRWVMSQ